MSEKKDPPSTACPLMQRRDFLRITAGAAGLGMAMGVMPKSAAAASAHSGKTLQVWSCGGLAEGMMPAHAEYEKLRGVTIAYTGAFAAVLGKSLMANGRTEVFCGRVLELAKNLRKAGRMVRFEPFCFTSYCIVVPPGNPKKIQGLEDLTKPGVRVAMAPEASPPGGAAVMGILKLSGLTEKIMPNVVNPGSCVQTIVQSVLSGTADAMIVEPRVPRLPAFAGKLEEVPIPPEFFPPGPLTFTIGLMQEAHDADLANDYIAWMTAEEGGQKHMVNAGFTSVGSERGKMLVEKLGVRDAG